MHTDAGGAGKAVNAIYARQSVEKKDSLSIEGQIEQCRRLAGDEARVFSDRGFSGKNTKRPAFTELMDAVENGAVGKIFVYRLDRFSRSIADFSRIWELLERHGVEFVSVTENFDTSTPIGRAMLNIVLVFAQLERETTAERVKDNYLHRFALGAWPGGPAPYGFALCKVEEDGRRVSSLVANDRAEVVRWIFERYGSEGTTLRSIARELGEKGIHGPQREAWDNVTLSRLLHSPLYVRADEEVYWHYLAKGLQVEQDAAAFDGKHACNVIGRRDRSRNKYNSLDGQRLTVANHEGIVDAALWLRVQDKLSGNRQIPRANAGKYSWLTGLLKCGRCGYAVKINYIKGEGRHSLVCSGRSNFARCDGSIALDLRELEGEVAAKISALLSENRPRDLPNSGGTNAAEILEIERKIERLVGALAESSDVSAGYISRQIEKLDKERERLLARGKSREPLPALDFGALGFDEKKLVAAQFIDRILLDGDEAEIVWKV